MTFTLKTLFIAVTVAAILLAIFFALPLTISMFVCGAISVVAPPGFVSWIVYGRGYGRAFAIGCTAASAVMLFSMGLSTVLFIPWMSGADAIEGMFVPVYSLDPPVDPAQGPTVVSFAAMFTPYPLGFSLVLLSGGLSVLVRWLTLRQRCLLE